MSDVMDCQNDCAVEKETCEDSRAAVKCSKCALECGEAYDGDMRKCLALVTRSTKSSYGGVLSDCELFASFDMDTCMMKVRIML